MFVDPIQYFTTSKFKAMTLITTMTTFERNTTPNYNFTSSKGVCLAITKNTPLALYLIFE